LCVFLAASPSDPLAAHLTSKYLADIGKDGVCKIIEATFLTLHFCPMPDFSQVKGGGGHDPSGAMVNTPVCRCLPQIRTLYVRCPWLVHSSPLTAEPQQDRGDLVWLQC